MIEYKEVIEKFNKLTPNYNLVTREELDLSNGRNTNIFPYKGQFSPDLIKVLLENYAKRNDSILDPFVGCGTVVFEAAKLDLPAVGTEINPAAYEMARSISFINLDKNSREKLVKEVYSINEKLVSETNLADRIEYLIKSEKNKFIYNILVNSFIRVLKNKKEYTLEDFSNSVKKHSEIIMSLPYNKTKYSIYLSDARAIPVKNKSVDLIITSPPYVNVFNYHQHNRSFIDRIYGDTLNIAKSEFGANRKNRQNRFLTVYQYFLDMVQTFTELKDKLRECGRIIIVVGRSSKVRGVNFRNDHIIALVGAATGYKMVERQERKFMNQFGEDIYESIIHFTPQINSWAIKDKNLLIIGKEILELAKNDSLSPEVKNDLVNAIDTLAFVKPSPIYNQKGD